MSSVIHIEQLVDGQKISRFNIKLLVWSFLAMFADGYDITVMANAAPDLARNWQLDTSTFGPVFSASLFGILFGAPLLGYVGDRFGRRTAVIAGSVIFSLSTLAVIWASSLDQIFALRFITGIGIGGLMPNMIALNSESSPKRFRATLIVLMFTGITLGSSTPGTMAAWLVPDYGWKSLFIIGGLVPLVVAVCLCFVLPESVKFLAQHPGRRSELLRTARRMRPDLAIADDTQFVTAHAPQVSTVGLGQIFGGGLAAITPLLWMCFATALMANYFLNSWMPLLFESNGLSPERAALTSAAYHIGGTAGGLLISVLLDRFGFLAIAALFALAAPAIALMGLEGLSPSGLLAATTVAGFAVLGAQFGNNAASGLLYSTEFRAKGVGWALAIGRFGSILGPLVGGMLIGMKLPQSQLFLAAAVPMVIGVAAALALARLCFRRLGGFQLDDTPLASREGLPGPDSKISNCKLADDAVTVR